MLFDPRTIGYVAAAVDDIFGEELTARKKRRKTHNKRSRRYVNSIFQELGAGMTRRAYRMHARSFWHLVELLDSHLDSYQKGREEEGQGSTGGAKNGFISNATRVSCAIRYFAGGRPEDIAVVHGVSHSEVFRSVWRVVDAVVLSDAPELALEFPDGHDRQAALAKEFQANSKAGFDNCVGAIDGMLVWIEQPTLASCKAAAVGQIKFFCGRKKKYGLGLQAVCDAHGRFTNIFIGHPATTSDYLAFTTSPLYFKLKNKGFLADGLCLYGDNAYVNTEYMVTPFKSVQSGPKYDFNFYHSQVREDVHQYFCLLRLTGDQPSFALLSAGSY